QYPGGNSALSLVSIIGYTSCAELLLNDSRIVVNSVNMCGHTPFWEAYNFSNVSIMKLLIAHGAKVVDSDAIITELKVCGIKLPSAEATQITKDWKLYLPEFTRYAKSNKYYPRAFKEEAFVFILCCVKSKAFPKDVIHLLLEYIARAWKLLK
ncbi:hypothetical protein KAU11_02500, partial [Candidatus Babeliales bacterium]|nr:hypothetical protein [Candidatus Babeliales bacterium]